MTLTCPHCKQRVYEAEWYDRQITLDLNSVRDDPLPLEWLKLADHIDDVTDQMYGYNRDVYRCLCKEHFVSMPDLAEHLREIGLKYLAEHFLMSRIANL